MINLKVVGAAALLAIAPALASSVADARPGGGGGLSRGGGGDGFRGGGGFAPRPNFGGAPRVGNFAGRVAIGGAAIGAGALASQPSFAGRPVPQLGAGRPVAQLGSNWQGHRHWRGRNWRGYGYGFGAGLTLGALGSSYYYNDPYDYDNSYAYAPDVYVEDEQYTAAPVSDGDATYCAQRYKSYDPASGTYLNYDGNRYPCP